MLNNILACTMTLFMFTGCVSNGDDPFASADANVVSFKVEGMACRNCAREIAHELEELPGVRAAVIDFDTATAKVALVSDPSKAPDMPALHAAVERWRREHFSLPEDPDCLDPAKRAELQQAATQQ